jgi:hypothetical protein
MLRAMRLLPLAALALLAAACSSTSTTPADGGSDAQPSADASEAGGGSMCTAAIEQLLAPIDKVSTGQVVVVSDTGGVKLLYVDASAGGFNAAATNPRTYVNLDTGKRVDVTDVSARASAEWDLAMKRDVIYTNGGDGGIGQGAALGVNKPFDQVTMADASGLAKESFVDANCDPKVDPIGAPITTFSGWYDYDSQTMKVSPRTGLTYVVMGGGGKLYKVEIGSYYGNSTGGTGTASAHYLLKVAAL